MAIPFVHIAHRYGLSDRLWAVIAAQGMFATPYAIFFSRATNTRGIVVLQRLMLTAAVLAACAGGVAHAQISVKLGVLNDRSGAGADITGEGSVIATRMAVDDFKPAEHGMKVEIVSADHQNKPDIGSSIVRQWFERDGVDAVVDVPVSSVGLAVSQIARDQNKVMLNASSASSDFSGKACSPNTVNWSIDSWALANGTGTAVTKRGGDTWFFLTADYAFGIALERDATQAVKKAGGQVLGAIHHPFLTADFSSYLQQAQVSKAKVIGLANSGGDTVKSVQQAAEFGVVQGGQSLAALLIYVTDVKAIGLQSAQGLLLTEAFYWDRDEGSRAFSKRFAERMGGKMSTAVHAAVYSSVLHYLKAVDALKSAKDGAAVVAKIEALPTDDPLFGKGSVRVDGRKLHDLYLFEVKKPAESKGEWDLYKVVATIPAAEAFRPLSDGGCPLVK